MKPLRMILSFALLLSFMGGCQKKEITSEERMKAERIIGVMQTRFSQAWSEKNLDALVSLYSNNAALYDENHPIIRGKNAIRLDLVPDLDHFD